MRQDPDSTFIRVNPILGKRPTIGFMPIEQIMVAGLIISVCYFVIDLIFGLGTFWSLFASAWLIVSWLLLTGTKPDKFIDQLRKPPGTEWIPKKTPYISPVPQFRPKSLKRVKPRQFLNAEIYKDENGKRIKLMPFQDQLDLCCLVEYRLEGRRIGGFLLKDRRGKYQIIFNFKNRGIHNALTAAEAAQQWESISQGFRELPNEEKITFCTSCTSDDTDRQKQLDKLIKESSVDIARILLRNEKEKVEELTHRQGIRKIWDQQIFCSSTADEVGESGSQDIVGSLVRTFSSLIATFSDFVGESIHSQKTSFYKKILLDAFGNGFKHWELILSRKCGFTVTAQDAEQMWAWLWRRFNNTSPPPIPQLLILEESQAGIVLREEKCEGEDANYHPIYILTRGTEGTSACPEHKGKGDRMFLPGKQRYCGVLRMITPVPQMTPREQLRFLWEVMSLGHAGDMEAWSEVTWANQIGIREKLDKQARHTRSRMANAFSGATGRDVGAEEEANNAHEAQRELYRGSRGLNCASVFLVHRKTPQQLDSACAHLSKSFGSAEVQRERNIAWNSYIQTLPISSGKLLGVNGLETRTMTVNTETIHPFLPITEPLSLDNQGVELLTTKGGKPLKIDLFGNESKRLLVTGSSGSGKSIFAWRFVVEALGHNIPTLGVDLSDTVNSTFRLAISLLGDKGAFYDIRDGSLNLMEVPDLRRFNKAEKALRMSFWKESLRQKLTAVCMALLDDPPLAQRVDSLLLLVLDMFISDPDIVERYNQALKGGWKSEAWQNIPVLADLLPFCSRERLGLASFEDIDKRALNQITTQIESLLASTLGPAIGRPSTFSPEPAIIFFGLSGLSNPQDQYLMAISALAACKRLALSYPKCFALLDEMANLFDRRGFPEMCGEFFGTGRKSGISVALLTTNLQKIVQSKAGQDIIGNANFRVTGRLEAGSTQPFYEDLNYPSNILDGNTSERYRRKTGSRGTVWIVEEGMRFWETLFIPSDMLLASVVTNPDEVRARDRIFGLYDLSTRRGTLEALSDFSIKYSDAINNGNSMDSIIAA